jgi:aspartyl-tRNA(Asn)/glutamyl-tRNA(Gln) amidotransferase subunit A
MIVVLTNAEASARRLRQGKPRSPLEGIPITVKDNIPVKNLRLTRGSRAFADHIAEHDELPVERLRNAGAVIVGKTNVPEFTVWSVSNRRPGASRE